MVDALKPLTASVTDIRKVPSALAELGIRLVIVQHLKGTKSDGVALWLDPTSPVIGMSLRYDRVDNFWFTLLHELSHIQHKHECPVDEDILATSTAKPAFEQVADNEAAAALVPHEHLTSFIQRCNSLYYSERVVQFSRSMGVHPGIVVGQLQHLKQLNYQQFSKFKEKVRHHISGQTIVDGWDSSPFAEDP